MDGDRVRLTVNIAFGSPIQREIWRWTESAQKYCNGRTCPENKWRHRYAKTDRGVREEETAGEGCAMSVQSLFRFNGVTKPSSTASLMCHLCAALSDVGVRAALASH